MRVRTLITSDKEIKNIMRIIKALEHSGLITKGATEVIANEVK